MSLETQFSEVLLSSFRDFPEESLSSVEFGDRFRESLTRLAGSGVIESGVEVGTNFLTPEIEEQVAKELPENFFGFIASALSGVYQAGVVLEVLRGEFFLDSSKVKGSKENSLAVKGYNRQVSQYEYVRVFALFEAVLAMTLAAFKDAARSCSVETGLKADIASGFSRLIADMSQLVVRLSSLEPAVEAAPVDEVMASLMRFEKLLGRLKTP